MKTVKTICGSLIDKLLVEIIGDEQLHESATLDTFVLDGIVSAYYLDKEKDIALFYEVDDEFNITESKLLSTIKFQHGPIPENGINGVTNENLLFIVLSRITALNSKYPCNENEKAIMYCAAALEMLELRTANRRNRGVEGKLVE